MTRVERETEEARGEVEGRLAAASAALDERAAALSAAAAQVCPRPPILQAAELAQATPAALAVSCKASKAASESTCCIWSTAASASCNMWHTTSVCGVSTIWSQLWGNLRIEAPLPALISGDS